MRQVVNCVCEETALLELQYDSSALEERENLTDMLNVSFGHRCKDHYVV